MLFRSIQERSTCGAADARDNIGHKAVHECAEAACAEDGDLFDEIAVCALETDNNAYGLDKSENDAHDTGDFFNLFPAVLFLGKFLKGGECNGEELKNNRRRDVGRDTHCKE